LPTELPAILWQSAFRWPFFSTTMTNNVFVFFLCITSFWEKWFLYLATAFCRKAFTSADDNIVLEHLTCPCCPHQVPIFPCWWGFDKNHYQLQVPNHSSPSFCQFVGFVLPLCPYHGTTSVH
jgi:hypothetical protein